MNIENGDLTRQISFVLVAVLLVAAGPAPTPKSPPPANQAKASVIENGGCKVPYNPLRWLAATCMAENNTDDLESPAVRSCMDTKQSPKFNDACAENLYWKTQWCKSFIQVRKDKTVESCVAERALVPSGVEGGF